MSSWIKLFRDINKHWIWQNSDYLKWWLDILLEVNHAPAKVVIKNKIYDCNRGEKLYSLDTWAYRWGTNKSKARRFLQLLQNDNMIVLKSETQTTRLIVCKYDTYQDMRHADETQMKHKRHANETHLTPIEEEKEGKELFLLKKEINKEKNDFENENIDLLEKVKKEKEKKVAPKKEKDIHTSFAHLKITFSDYDKLLELGYSDAQIKNVFEKIENYNKNTNYKSLYLTAKNWLEKEIVQHNETRTNSTNKEQYRFSTSEAIKTITSGNQ